jgi:hypothetical protein
MKLQMFDELLAKEMTRREFLLHIGLLLFVLTGASALMKTLSDPQLLHKSPRSQTGFGSGPYGV